MECILCYKYLIMSTAGGALSHCTVLYSLTWNASRFYRQCSLKYLLLLREGSGHVGNYHWLQEYQHKWKGVKIYDFQKHCCCQSVPDLYINPADSWRIITIVLTFKCADVKYLVRKEHNPPIVSLKFTKAALLFAAPSAESHSWPPGTDAGGDILTYSQAEEVEK